MSPGVGWVGGDYSARVSDSCLENWKGKTQAGQTLWLSRRERLLPFRMACLFWVLDALGLFKSCPFQEDHKEGQGTSAERRGKSLLRVPGAEEEVRRYTGERWLRILRGTTVEKPTVRVHGHDHGLTHKKRTCFRHLWGAERGIGVRAPICWVFWALFFPVLQDVGTWGEEGVKRSLRRDERGQPGQKKRTWSFKSVQNLYYPTGLDILVSNLKTMLYFVMQSSN